LSGSIPPELGSLANLGQLFLASNHLTGGIPAELGNLTNLGRLVLYSNHLSGSIPSALGNLTNLYELNLSTNQLSGSIPPELGNLTNLETLALDRNRLSGEIPDTLTGLVNLNAVPGFTYTDLGYNMLTSSDSGVIGFLDDKDPDWAQTQTVLPKGLNAASMIGSAAELSWTPILYTTDGGYYEVSYATSESGPYSVHGTTGSKSASGYTAGGLTPGLRYCFLLRTYTPAHGAQQNSLWSDYSAPVCAEQAYFTTTLGVGWNLVSFPLIPTTTNPRELLSGLGNAYDIVHTWDSAAQSWLTFNPSLPDPQTLDVLDLTNGFWIHLVEEGILRVGGSQPTQTSIELSPGWNMVGFPASASRGVQTALASVAGKFTLLYEHNASNPDNPWRKYNPNAPSFVSTLTALTPGMGYWIRATEACTWVVTY
jgi:hypothetical protein